MRALNGTEAVSVTALARLTGVSAVTIRRDLKELAHKGLVTRVHGGALRAPKRGTAHPFPLRKTQDLEAKHLLAKATARLIDDGESVILDNGTTCEMVAENLVGRDIRALCLSLSAAATLASTPGPVVTVPGGIVETDTLAMLTTTAVDAVRRFRADVAILGACAVSAQSGLTCTEDHDAVLKAAIIGSSSRCLMPAPPRKLTRSSTYGFGELSNLDTLLTTTDIDPETLTGLQEAGVSVEVHDV